jgi:hypothetical protein
MNGPTLAGYVDFIRDVMGINSTILPANSPWIEFSFKLSNATCSNTIGLLDEFLYETAVYNLAGDTLLTYTVDQPGQTFFKDVQKKYQLQTFVPGIIKSAADESTSSSMVVPEAFNKLTIGQLQNLKTPYGRLYLQIAQDLGSLSLLQMA